MPPTARPVRIVRRAAMPVGHTVRIVRGPAVAPFARAPVHGGYAVRVARRPVGAHRPRRPRRAWGRRGRRAQASAIATLLGLLIVVTLIANFITTVLPNQMAVNDGAHEQQVENELGRLSQLLNRVAGTGLIGTSVTQPVVLGSAADPPFAGADGSSVVPYAAVYGGSPVPGVTVSYTLAGKAKDLPPNGGAPNVGNYTGGCSSVGPSPPTSIGCSGSSTIYWNFSAGDFKNYSATGNGGTLAGVNFTTNYSTITVSFTGGPVNNVGIFGNHNIISITAKGGANWHVLMVGNYNALTFKGTGGASASIYEVGDHDTIVATSTGGGNVVLVDYGVNDTFAGTGSGTSIMQAYIIGFNAENPQSAECPYGNTGGTDTVSGSYGGGGTATYNNSTGSNSTHSGGGWTYVSQSVSSSFCPFFSEPLFLLKQAVFAGFLVELHNSYLPHADVGFDEGAVVLAQPGAQPIMLDGPSMSFANGSLAMRFPSFFGSTAVESGIATADLVARLSYETSLNIPGNGIVGLASGSQVVVSIVTPFASAWMGYLASQSEWTGLFACSGPAAACSGPYTTLGPLGTVTLTIPAPQTFSLKLTQFSLLLR